MLDKIDLSKSFSKNQAKDMLSSLEPKLSLLQRELKNLNIPVMIVFEGLDASGKGTQISNLISPLDPRGFEVFTIGKETTEERMHPFMWRFWTKTPANGTIAIYDGSWYRRVLQDVFSGDETRESLPASLDAINSFEKQLVDGGMLIVKFFFVISKKEQSKRFENLLSKKSTSWRVTKDDLDRNKNYDSFIKLSDEMLLATDTEYANWTIVEATDKEYARVKVLNQVVNAFEEAIETVRTAPKGIVDDGFSSCEMTGSALAKADLTKCISDKEYKDKLDKLQKKLGLLHSQLYAKRVPVVLVFEGWDAGGKGGAIKRLTNALDPRGYVVNPSSAPNDIERSHHYLWRFWKKIPKDGHISIFDRSWYGRVMVERIEGFCCRQDWERAFKEINKMEKQFYDHGAVVLKFWMQIDKDEQEKRFKERQTIPEKNWKITDEDWRNREKWDSYEKAVDEMLIRTSTEHAPWIIVEGNDKKYARIKVIETVVDALEKALKSK